jgi:hypothetical protein
MGVVYRVYTTLIKYARTNCLYVDRYAATTALPWTTRRRAQTEMCNTWGGEKSPSLRATRLPLYGLAIFLGCRPMRSYVLGSV